MRVPVIDIAPFLRGQPEDRQRVAAAVDAACRDLGFLVITGHGVAPGIVRGMHQLSDAFFALPVEEKTRVALGKVANYAGYTLLGSDKLSYSLDGAAAPETIQPDLKESFSMGPFGFPGDDYHTGAHGSRFFQDNIWPERPTGMKHMYETYYRRLEGLAADIMRIFALGLGLDEEYFTPSIDRHISHLVVQHYPAQDRDPAPGQIRAGAHSDFGSLTILHLGDRPEGLQVRDRTGAWHDIAAPEDAFVVNIGDLMEQWTNGVWRSTMHRVINPVGQVRARARRQTITFFQQPNYDAMIECIETCTSPAQPPRFAPETSGDHYEKKIGRMRQIEDRANPAA